MKLPQTYNYIGAFLSFACPYSCSYCINRNAVNPKLTYKHIPGREWVRFFKNLDVGDVPVTFQGGEPGCHPDFVDIVRGVSEISHVDILTNLVFDLEEFVRKVDPEALNRDAPYAPIRVSYHPEQFSFDEILRKVRFLADAGFRIGLYGVLHPEQEANMQHAEAVCRDMGVDFRTKPFLGKYDGKQYGEYAYADACNGDVYRSCECSPSELLIAPDGAVFPCHHHIYNNTGAVGSIMDDDLVLGDEYHPCDNYGACNPCDVKIKNNRFQQFGHVSVKIRSIAA